MKIVIGSDEFSASLHTALRRELDVRGIATHEVGPPAQDQNLATRVATHVSDGGADQGILVCRSGRAVAHDANRLPRVRAAMCVTPHMARIARSRNNGNVLIMGSDLVDEKEGLDVLAAWLGTPYGDGAAAPAAAGSSARPPAAPATTAAPAAAVADPLAALRARDASIARVIEDEEARQVRMINLIASENYASAAVRAAQGSVLSNKYAEGYPGKRWYNGCEAVDVAEQLAIDRAKELFGAEHANVQPHSGSGANMAVYYAVCEPGDTLLSMSLDHGGHLTHGHPKNFSGRFFEVVPYGVEKETERLDYDVIAKLAAECRPRIIVVGASAYSREFDFERLRRIADDSGAYLMADIAHIAGLIAARLHADPVPLCEFVTSTTHKTLRGPRGGLILCKGEFAKVIDRQIFPGVQGGPAMHTIAAKAVCFGEALQPEFKAYARQIIENARALSATLTAGGLRIVSGGTDNHLMMVDVTPLKVTGQAAATALESAGIAVNKNAIPYDANPPAVASGIRIGTPAVTTRGMTAADMRFIGEKIVEVLRNVGNADRLNRIRSEVQAFALRFPVP